MNRILHLIDGTLTLFLRVIDWIVMLAAMVLAFLAARAILEMMEYGPLVQYGGALLVAIAAGGVARLVWWLFKLLNS